MTPEVEQRIRERAYAIWCYRQTFGMTVMFEKGNLREITAQDDWLLAQEEVLD